MLMVLISRMKFLELVLNMVFGIVSVSIISRLRNIS